MRVFKELHSELSQFQLVFFFFVFILMIKQKMLKIYCN